MVFLNKTLICFVKYFNMVILRGKRWSVISTPYLILNNNTTNQNPAGAVVLKRGGGGAREGGLEMIGNDFKNNEPNLSQHLSGELFSKYSK